MIDNQANRDQMTDNQGNRDQMTDNQTNSDQIIDNHDIGSHTDHIKLNHENNNSNIKKSSDMSRSQDRLNHLQSVTGMSKRSIRKLCEEKVVKGIDICPRHQLREFI